jgi:hypothetical protein
VGILEGVTIAELCLRARRLEATPPGALDFVI